MPDRRRNSPALPLTSARLLDVLDRMYDLEASEPDWMRGIAEAIRPIVDCGAGINVLTYPTAGKIGVRVGLGHNIETMWRQFSRAVPLDVLAEAELIGPLSNAARCTIPRIRSYAAAGHAAMGVRSLTGLNGTDLEHRLVTIGVPAPVGGRVFWPEHDRTAWERISAHLGATFRMRNHRVARAAPGVIIAANGGLQHVEPGVADVDLARLREAVTAVDRVRRVRMPPEAVLDAWRALYGGRWSIMASVERDGRRLLVARPNAPLSRGEHRAAAESTDRPRPANPHRLSAQETRVLIALAEGHSNKLIAYELGLATSTVGTLLARAASKLGCKNRIALARVGRALAHQAAPPCVAEDPA